MTWRAALLPLAVLAAAAAAPEEGWQAYTAGHPAEAIPKWAEAAAAGSADAAFGLATAYDLGQGVPQDTLMACHWYRRAGEAGITAAAFNVAVLLDQGLCGPRDPADVAAWYGRAAAAGHPRAEYDLAQLYESGDGVPRNTDAALAWYRLAAGSGLAAASVRVETLSRSKRDPNAGLTAVLPVFPVGETVPDRGLPVAFVWAAPPQPGFARFFLEVDLVSQDGSKELAAQYVDQSAALVTLQPGTAQYAWRVSTVLPGAHRYVVSDWVRFQILGRTGR